MSHQKPRLVRVATAEGPRWAIVDVDDESEGTNAPQPVYELPGPPHPRLERGAEIGRLDEVQLLAPTTPTKIVCVGRNYPAHAAEHAAEVPAEPLLFLKPPSSVIGPGAAIVLTPQSEQVEYEAEMAVVVGRRCRNVTPERAWSYVLGVTCANDVTARDLQRRDAQWTRAKGFDTFCPLGPWIVTGLGEEDVADLQVACRVNGELRQRGRTSEMVFSPAQLIAYTASIMTLEPGDVILTGTPAGVGPLAAGDTVEIKVEGIGMLRNPVVEEPKVEQ